MLLFCCICALIQICCMTCLHFSLVFESVLVGSAVFSVYWVVSLCYEQRKCYLVFISCTAVNIRLRASRINFQVTFPDFLFLVLLYCVCILLLFLLCPLSLL
jgi:hypothetical protein